MVPDYELEPVVTAETPEQLKAIADPLRTQILDLVLERAATVTELAAALERPKSSVAYHVDALVDAGLLKVVRTRKVRAIEERFYGRTGRAIIIGDGSLPDGTRPPSFFALAESESRHASGDEMRSTIRHARIPPERAEEFFARLVEIADEFAMQPREGDVVYGLVAGVFATDHPTLPNSNER